MTTTDIIARNLFRLLRAGIFSEELPIEPMSAWKWRRLYQYSLIHGVAALLYDGIRLCESQFFMQLPDDLTEAWEKGTRETEERNQQEVKTLTQLFPVFTTMQLRPMLLHGQGFAALYPQPVHRTTTGIHIFFPFDTKGEKADAWAKENSHDIAEPDKYTLEYQYQGLPIQNKHRILLLTNRFHSYSLQNIVQQELRESKPSFAHIGDMQMETLSPTLTLFHQLLVIAQSMLNNGMLLCQLADVGLFLRKQGDKADYVKLQEWIDKMKMKRMAQLTGELLVQLLDFHPDEIPFMTPEISDDISPVVKELFLLQPHKSDKWYFQQGNGIFVGTVHSSAMLWQARHSMRYLSYYPSECITNMFSSFTHSLSHIEE